MRIQEAGYSFLEGYVVVLRGPNRLVRQICTLQFQALSIITKRFIAVKAHCFMNCLSGKKKAIKFSNSQVAAPLLGITAIHNGTASML